MLATEPNRSFGSAPSFVSGEQDDMLSTLDTRGKRLSYRVFLVADLLLVWLSAGFAFTMQRIGMRAIHPSIDLQFNRTIPLDLLFLFSVFVALFAHTQGFYEFPTKRTYRDDLKCWQRRSSARPSSSVWEDTWVARGSVWRRCS